MSARVALVTGATEGIGRATAFALGRAGYAVGVCARNPETLAALLDALAAEKIDAAGLPADVGNPAQVEALVAHVAERLGPIDVLVNNAGIAVLKPLSGLSLSEWDATMGTNLRSLFLTCRAVLPGMTQRGAGVIVNLASLAGHDGFAGGTAYCASKHAVLGFSRSLMLEVRKLGVRVVSICPGSVDTPLLRNQQVFEVKPDILQPEDVAQVIVDVLQLPSRALVSELDIRPSNP